MNRDELIAIARLYDTTMAHAMLKALGAKPLRRRKRRRHRRQELSRRDVIECMRQSIGALDRS